MIHIAIWDQVHWHTSLGLYMVQKFMHRPVWMHEAFFHCSPLSSQTRIHTTDASSPSNHFHDLLKSHHKKSKGLAELQKFPQLPLSTAYLQSSHNNYIVSKNGNNSNLCAEKNTISQSSGQQQIPGRTICWGTTRVYRYMNHMPSRPFSWFDIRLLMDLHAPPLSPLQREWNSSHYTLPN